MSRKITIALIGFGNSARRLAELLIEKEAQIEANYQISIKCTAIVTANNGAIVDNRGIDLKTALDLSRAKKTLNELVDLKGARAVNGALAAIDECGAQIVIETTPLNIIDGEPALTHIKHALNCNKHVITANK